MTSSNDTSREGQTTKQPARKVTLKEVAKEAGVSVATTSYVLNKQKSFSKETVERVERAVEKLQYRPNYSAQAVRTGKTKSIGLVLPNQQDPFFPELAKAVENFAHRLGYSVILIDTQQDRKVEKESALRLIELGVDGIIWCPLAEPDAYIHQHKRIPLVVIDRPQPKPEYDLIHCNHIDAGKKIADHALSLGHTKIGLIAAPKSLPATTQRLKSFKDSISEKAHIIWEVENPLSPDLTEDTKAALSRQDVSLVVAGNDLVAIGAIMYLREIELTVPNDISIIGYDGTRLSDIVSPKLTTIKQPISEIGASAVNMLMERINHPDLPIRHLALDAELIEGESTIPYH